MSSGRIASLHPEEKDRRFDQAAYSQDRVSDGAASRPPAVPPVTTDRFSMMRNKIGSLGAERLVALALMIFAVAELYAASRLAVTEEFTLGPGAMPLIYGVGLLIFASVLAARPQNGAPLQADAAEGEDAPVRDYRSGGITYALLILLIASVYFLGFLIGTILFSFLYLLLVIRWKWFKAAMFSVIWGAALYYTFSHLLQIQLEPGLVFGG
jgi:Tripartite tricarboxylate transporter TctB family